MKKIILILVATLVVCVLSGCSNSTSKREEIHDDLSYMADDLYTMSYDAKEAYDSDDYEYMKEILYSLYEKCHDLSNKAYDLSRLFRDEDPEENRRSWFY